MGVRDVVSDKSMAGVPCTKLSEYDEGYKEFSSLVFDLDKFLVTSIYTYIVNHKNVLEN